MTTGVSLAAGGGTWSSLSDRNLKNNVTVLDDESILNRVAMMPITEWSYISEPGVRHVGPMAQDFYAAFGVGEDNRHVTSIDEDGVALAAIKALHHQRVRDEQRIATLEKQLAETNARLAQLAKRIR
ncbi:MAG: tail fiber domain-containing protein [Candidatus Eremiobacteraeota bacterium]|nr:tail fiber domain-containing protein [Candidatus Eremiobacteraeota bacterium]